MTFKEREYEEALRNIIKFVTDLNLVNMDASCPNEEALFHILCFACRPLKNYKNYGEDLPTLSEQVQDKQSEEDILLRSL